MIEKERLEKLIEEGEKIWAITNGRVVGFPTSKRDYFDTRLDGTIIYSNDKYNADLKLENLYETQEDAEWVVKHHTNREIKFTPCSYEDAKRYSINDCYTYGFVDTFLIPCEIVIDFEEDYACVNRGNFTPQVFKKATKENYIKAVEFSYKLFKGESEDEKETN